jgi:hypothetical protein
VGCSWGTRSRWHRLTDFTDALTAPQALLLAKLAARRQILESQQLDQLVLIEADNRFAIDKGHWRALKSCVEQFLQRSLIGTDIFLDELDALLR